MFFPSFRSSLQCVQITMKRILDQCFVNNPEVDSRPGRLGPAVTKFDIHSKVGHFFFWPDKFSLNAQSNFCTILANSCVYEGIFLCWVLYSVVYTYLYFHEGCALAAKSGVSQFSTWRIENYPLICTYPNIKIYHYVIWLNHVCHGQP